MRDRRWRVLAGVSVVAVVAALLPPVVLAQPAAAATACPAGGCAVTVDVRDYPTAQPLANFTT